MTASKKTTDDESSAVRSVVGAWMPEGAFIEASSVGMGALATPLALGDLLDEFSIAVLFRDKGVTRSIAWPATGGTTLAMTARFSVLSEEDDVPSQILMAAIADRDDVRSPLANLALMALNDHAVNATRATATAPDAIPPLLVGDASTIAAARSAAAAMLALAGDLRQLCETVRARNEPMGAAGETTASGAQDDARPTLHRE